LPGIDIRRIADRSPIEYCAAAFVEASQEVYATVDDAPGEIAPEGADEHRPNLGRRNA
jgi:hypothetical protein